MPLSQVEAREFTDIARFLDVAPNKIPAMIKLAGKIVDKIRPAAVHKKAAQDEFVGVVKESYRLWITPDIRAEYRADLGTEAVPGIVVSRLLVRVLYAGSDAGLTGLCSEPAPAR
jgi:hypothetical protein